MGKRLFRCDSPRAAIRFLDDHTTVSDHFETLLTYFFIRVAEKLAMTAGEFQFVSGRQRVIQICSEFVSE
jgi:hypothetical protein